VLENFLKRNPEHLTRNLTKLTFMQETNGKRILVIEDEPSLREAIKFKLERHGFIVDDSETGEHGLELLAENKPDLVWLDMLLPGISGLEVLRKIRAIPGLETLKVLVVSVSSGEEKIKEMLRMGALDYIIKSNYSIDEIIAKAEEVLN
jgi:DNA-binding response OmpR family regulator